MVTPNPHSILYHISFLNLAISLIPVFIVAAIYTSWSLSAKMIYYATARMLAQLLCIGYALIFIFQNDSGILIFLVLMVMLFSASWISIRPITHERRDILPRIILGLGVGCLSTIALVVLVIVRMKPWYEARYLIPIAGMIFSNAMNSVSLAVERFESERKKETIERSKIIAFQTALLPILNSYFAVGLVSLPGMMTGQILSGISPLIAVRYQIVVMSMLLGGSGIAVATYLHFRCRDLQKKREAA